MAQKDPSGKLAAGANLGLLIGYLILEATSDKGIEDCVNSIVDPNTGLKLYAEQNNGNDFSVNGSDSLRIAEQYGCSLETIFVTSLGCIAVARLLSRQRPGKPSDAVNEGADEWM